MTATVETTEKLLLQVVGKGNEQGFLFSHTLAGERQGMNIVSIPVENELPRGIAAVMRANRIDPGWHA